jgi:glycosyltransferase involved in cell wall biosynthesis
VSTPAISIVLPTYNGSRYLAEAIDSCLCQSCTDWELIIVDDASTDATPAIIAGYLARDSRIRQIRHAANKKLPAALNTGFASARGAFFTWTSDDNCYEPGSLEQMLACLRARPERDIVYTDYGLMDEDSRVTTPRVAVKDPCHLVFGNCVGPNFLYRRAVHEALSGFDEGLFLVEDYDFWLRASIRFPLVALHEVLYRYREHGGSLTATRTRDIALAHKEAFLRSVGAMTWLSSRARVLGLIGTSRLARARGERQEANRILLEAIRTAPLGAGLVILRMLVQGPDIIYRISIDGTAGGGR